MGPVQISISWYTLTLHLIYKLKFPIHVFICDGEWLQEERQSASWHEHHSSTLRPSDKRLEKNVYSIITRAFEYKGSGNCHIFVVSLQFVLPVAIFYFYFFSYYYLCYFLSLPLPFCDRDKMFAKRFFSSQAIYHRYELL
jgi:hypothetical protein